MRINPTNFHQNRRTFSFRYNFSLWSCYVIFKQIQKRLSPGRSIFGKKFFSGFQKISTFQAFSSNLASTEFFRFFQFHVVPPLLFFDLSINPNFERFAPPLNHVRLSWNFAQGFVLGQPTKCTWSVIEIRRWFFSHTTVGTLM